MNKYQNGSSRPYSFVKQNNSIEYHKEYMKLLNARFSKKCVQHVPIYSLHLKDSSKSIVKNHKWEAGAGASAYFWFDYIRLRKYSNGICSKDAS